MTRPRCSVLTGGFDFSGSGDFTCCPPIKWAETSNSEPSAIVLHGMPCIGGLYISFDLNGEKRVRSSIFDQGSPRFTLSRSRMRSRTGLVRGARHDRGAPLRFLEICIICSLHGLVNYCRACLAH